uniref:Nitrilase 1 n=1 Tax=Pavo cristatus TaxID=9049 RepID=A0A8C9LG67_PAVCR
GVSWGSFGFEEGLTLCPPPRLSAVLRLPLHRLCPGPRTMAVSLGPKPLVAVGQVTSTPDKEQNFSGCAALVRAAARQGACLVFLPEGFDYIGRDSAQTLSLAESLDGELMARYSVLARDCGVWLSLGGFHERRADWPSTQRIYNCHVLLDPTGRLAAAYRKTHLCDVELEGRVTMKESSFTNPGTEIVPPISTPAGMVLLRARAIETQCYVVAAAQTGRNHEGRMSYGHTLVADPWGTVVAQCSEGPGLCYAEIDLEYLHRVRREIPVQSHRRADLYGTVGLQAALSAP